MNGRVADESPRQLDLGRLDVAPECARRHRALNPHLAGADPVAEPVVLGDRGVERGECGLMPTLVAGCVAASESSKSPALAWIKPGFRARSTQLPGTCCVAVPESSK